MIPLGLRFPKMSDNATLDAFDQSGGGANGAGNEPTSSEDDSDEYGTPRWVIRKLTERGLFDLDPTAGAEPIPIATNRYVKEDDGLSQVWATPDVDSIYLNPPYSDPKPFLQKLKHAVDPDDPNAATWAVSLTKADTSTGWFHEHVVEASVLCFVDKRLKFYGGKQGAKFANVFAAFGDPPQHIIEALSDMGELYTRVQVANAMEQKSLEDLWTDGGVAAAPVSMAAGPSSGGISTPHHEHASLDYVSPHDTIEMTFDTDSLAVQCRDVPERVTVEVLPEGTDLDAHEGSISIATAGATDDGTDVCAEIRNSANLVSQLEVSLSVGMGGWELATPTSVTVSPDETGSPSYATC